MPAASRLKSAPSAATPPATAPVKSQAHARTALVESDSANGRALPAATFQPPAPVAKPVKPPKLRKPKPVRDSFTMPRAEYELIDLLKRRAQGRGHKVKKSELLRAGILALADMADAQLFAAIAAVPVIKTGRPALAEKAPVASMSAAAADESSARAKR